MSNYEPTQATQSKGGQATPPFKAPSTIMSTRRKQAIINDLIKKAEKGDTQCQLFIAKELLHPIQKI